MTAAIERQDYDVARDEMRALLDSLGLTVECEFVPLSRSRNAGEKHPTVNWRCTVKRGAHRPLTVDYQQGSAHLDTSRIRSLTYRWYATGDGVEAIKEACETGKGRYLTAFPNVRAIEPSREDVISSLCLDASVLDSASFEEWASDFGYDADSRKAEAIYRECLKHALALRSMVGDAALTQLREQAQRF